MSDTPISDSTPENVVDLGMLCRKLERLTEVRLAYIKQLESQNNELRAEEAHRLNTNGELKRRIKRLVMAGDALLSHSHCTDYHEKVAEWNESKRTRL